MTRAPLSFGSASSTWQGTRWHKMSCRLYSCNHPSHWPNYCRCSRWSSLLLLLCSTQDHSALSPSNSWEFVWLPFDASLSASTWTCSPCQLQMRDLAECAVSTWGSQSHDGTMLYPPGVPHHPSRSSHWHSVILVSKLLHTKRFHWHSQAPRIASTTCRSRCTKTLLAPPCALAITFVCPC